MSATDFVVPILSSVFSAGGAGALVAYVRDRRLDKAKGMVAEATVDVDVDTDRLALVEARVTQLSNTWDRERASLNRTIDHLERENAAKDQKIAAQDKVIAALQRRVAEIDQRTTDNGS